MIPHSPNSTSRLQKPHSRDLRKGRYSRRNGIYLATFVTKKRNPLFESFKIARLVVRLLNNSPHAKTLAFVVMPDHVHWLMQLNSSKSISQTIQSVKILCTKSVNAQTGQKGTIWGAGFHDHAIRNEQALKEIGRYVVGNPVRSGLVESVKDYPHWDAVWL